MKFSRSQEAPDNAYLIQKYGLQSVETLIDYLEDKYSKNVEEVDLKQAQKVQDQIKYLRNERARHFDNQKKILITHIMNCLEEQKATILEQFEEEKQQNLAQLVNEAVDIENCLLEAHEIQRNELEEQLSKNYQNFVDKKSQAMIELSHQLEELCLRQEYHEAQLTKKILEKEIIKHRIRKNNQWKDHIDKQMKILECRQEKEMNSVRARVKALIEKEIKSKENQFERLVKKMQMHSNKIYKSLIKESRYKGQLNSIASSRIMLRQSRNISNSGLNISKQLYKLEPQTGPCSQAHTDRKSPPPQ